MPIVKDKPLLGPRRTPTELGSSRGSRSIHQDEVALGLLLGLGIRQRAARAHRDVALFHELVQLRWW